MLAAKNFIYYDKNFTAWFVFAVIKKRGLLKKKSAREVLFVEILFLWAEQKNIYLPRWLIHNFFLLRAEGKAESLHIKPVKNF